MNAHEFIFVPGQWLGEGRITFTVSPEVLHFYNKWNVEKIERGMISCQQEVEMEGREENLFNNFTFSEFLPSSFSVELTNQLLGTLKGKGIIDVKTIAWEFSGYPDFEGFEVYELQENGDYMMHAEYISSDQFRTIIDGRIWKKITF